MSDSPSDNRSFEEVVAGRLLELPQPVPATLFLADEEQSIGRALLEYPQMTGVFFPMDGKCLDSLPSAGASLTLLSTQVSVTLTQWRRCRSGNPHYYFDFTETVPR